MYRYWSGPVSMCTGFPDLVKEDTMRGTIMRSEPNIRGDGALFYKLPASKERGVLRQ